MRTKDEGRRMKRRDLFGNEITFDGGLADLAGGGLENANADLHAAKRIGIRRRGFALADVVHSVEAVVERKNRAVVVEAVGELVNRWQQAKCAFHQRVLIEPV